MSRPLSLKQVSQAMGVSIDTLRYYERIGLLPRVKRSVSSRQRTYTEIDLSWVDFFLQCKQAGMSINDMQTLARLHREGNTTAEQIRQLFETHRVQIAAQLTALTKHLEVVDFKINYYKGLEAQQQNIPRPDDEDKMIAQRPHLEKKDKQL